MTAAEATPVAIIPARGGSKAIPRKNIVDLGGRPLISWTIEAALHASVQPVVTTDDEEIAAVAGGAGARVIMRPSELAADHVHSIHAVLHALDELEQDGHHLDVALMLLPTSPFRSADDVRGAVALFHSATPPAVISVAPLDKQLIHLRTIGADGELVPFVNWDQLTAQRQEQPPLFGLNGSIYVAAVDVLRANSTFHVPGAQAFVMSPQHSIDINEPTDLAHARYLLETAGP